jgi:hypothetical protein
MNNHATLRSTSGNRRGSTLMIVIVLLGLLSILGVLFYTFAAAERSNAEYYAQGAKNTENPGLPADVVFDHALQQFIVGTDPRLKNSALWGSRHSLNANMLGMKNHTLTDRTAFDGTGVNLTLDMDMMSPTYGESFVDQDFDGTPDFGQQLLDENGQPVPTRGTAPFSDVNDLLGINDSPAANERFERQTGRFPQPDVGYTYPDINNLFLTHVGWVRDRNDPSRVRRVIIPSFHRPQILRRNISGTLQPPIFWKDLNYDGANDLAVPQWAPDAANPNADTFKNRSLRPHPGHLYVPPSQQGATTVPRYISRYADAVAAFGDGKHVFPFLPMYDGYNPQDGGGSVNLVGRPAQWIGHQGVWSGPHPVDASFNDDYQLDVDNDGDGIRDGIWIDLEFPVQELPDGTTYTVLHSFTVYDLNGLLQLNAHGNIQQLLFHFDSDVANPRFPFDNLNNRFGWNSRANPPRHQFISASNQGMHAAEVNPAWAFTGRPGLEVAPLRISDVFEQYRLFFGNLPQDWSMASPAEQRGREAWLETANMELAFLKMGRPQLNAGTGSLDGLHAGLYGEEHLIAQNLGAPGTRDPRLYPHPGRSLVDDNNDLNEGMETYPRNNGGGTPVWLDVDQPFDAVGIGSFWPGVSIKQRDLFNPFNPTSSLGFTRYANYTSNGNVLWGLSAPPPAGIASGALMNPPQPYGLFDDPSEVQLYDAEQRDVDDPFAHQDAVFLAMSNNDITNLGITSRLQDVARFNLSTDDSTNLRGEQIRKRVTTLANDRKNFSLPRAPGVGGRNFEWTDDQGRTLEQIRLDQQQDQFKVRFPPTFGDVGSIIPRYKTWSPGSPVADPFRPAVRFLLQATRDDLQVARQYQQRLSVNQLLTYNLQTQELEYRDLTVHPVNPLSAVIPSDLVNYNTPGARPVSPQQFEYCARRDRQLLCRDIYVLLYLLGAGVDGDSVDNLTRTGWTSSSNAYTDQQLEQMARFAVNLVDALDRDNVVTRFEYDINLSNGWNLDDDPYTLDGGAERREVWGVERQELSFSEAIVVHTEAEGGNRSQTSWDDQEERQFLSVELRNHAPYNVKFTDNEQWQLVLRQFEPQDGMVYNPANERQIFLRNTAGVVPAGGFYTLFTTDRNEPATNPSVMQIDPDGMTGVIPIVPNVPLGDPFLTTSASAAGNHMDMVEDAVTSGDGIRVTLGDGTTDLTGSPGSVLSDGTPGGLIFTDLTQPLHLILRRRAHPTRTRPTNGVEGQDNPWVEVDRMVLDFQRFNYPDSGNDATGQLANMRSTERREPLDRSSEGLNTTAGFARNTLSNNITTANSAENSLTPPLPEGIRLWQAHFDRKFASLGELLLLPVVGPPSEGSTIPRTDGLTLYFGAMWQPPVRQYGLPASPPPPTNRFQNFAKNAHGMFAMPNNPVLGDPDPSNTADPFDNRWHRLLEFLEVPTRQHRNLGVGDEFDVARVPGKINLNAIRHPEVLAGMIDDENVADLNLVYDNTQVAPATIANSNYPFLEDQFEPSGPTRRDWFEQLQESRDPIDPYWESPAGGGQLLPLPGLAGSRPFRSFAFTQDPYASIEHTLLRTLPRDFVDYLDPPLPAPPSTRRHLFEVATYGEHTTPGAVPPLDPVLKHRILSKMWNNTTTRSNTFVVFMSAKLFRAYVDPATGAVQIGGPLREFSASDPTPEQPEYRGVFLVDRSDLEGAGDAGAGGLTSFRPFVKFRRTLQE